MDKAKLSATKRKVTAKAEEAGKVLKKVPKQFYYAAGALALYYWGLKPIAKEIGDMFNADAGNDEFQEGKGDVVKRPTGDGSTQKTLTDVEIKSIALGQLGYMDRPGTNNRIMDDLVNLSGKDLQRVYTAFGRVWYDPVLGTQSGSFFSWLGHQELDLFGWYREELDLDELEQMRQIWLKSGLHFPAAGTKQSNPLS